RGVAAEFFAEIIPERVADRKQVNIGFVRLANELTLLGLSRLVKVFLEALDEITVMRGPNSPDRVCGLPPRGEGDVERLVGGDLPEQPRRDHLHPGIGGHAHGARAGLERHEDLVALLGQPLGVFVDREVAARNPVDGKQETDLHRFLLAIMPRTSQKRELEKNNGVVMMYSTRPCPTSPTKSPVNTHASGRARRSTRLAPTRRPNDAS